MLNAMSSAMSNTRDAVEVRSSPVHGAGAFALLALPRGALIGFYEGRRYPPDVLVEADSTTEITYLFGLSDGTTIDGMEGGNATRHLNHSCAPNCEASEHCRADGSLELRIVAKRAIAAGAELFIDYALVLDDADDGLYACLCGARRCRGTRAAAATA